MATVCAHCFADRELLAFINSQERTGKCNFCGTESASCVSTDELVDFFNELLGYFKPDESGTALKSLIQGNWSLFSSLDTAYAILNHILSDGQLSVTNADEIVSFTDDILENVGFWDRLKERLRTESRYITDISYLTEELGWDGFFGSQIEIPKAQVLYRARLHSNSGEAAFGNQQMLCPPPTITKAGRANPAGIPYLYLSDNRDTVLYEIRAAYLDEVSIGHFNVKNEVDKPVLIADFTESNTLFHPAKVGEKIKAALLKQKISADLSKPMRRYDSELDYIPTQFICEFIKIYTGVDGIKFRSSLHTLGNNYVIFNQDLMECSKVQQVKVHKVVISFK